MPNLIKLDNQAVTAEEKTSEKLQVKAKPRREFDENPRVENRREDPRREELRREEPKREEQKREQSPLHNDPPRPARNRNVPKPADNRNENILCAVLSLIKELDQSGLELVQRDIERKLGNR